MSKSFNDALHLQAWGEALLYVSEQLAKAREWKMPIEDTFRLQFNAARMWLEQAWDGAVPEAEIALRAVCEPRESGSIPDGSA